MAEKITQINTTFHLNEIILTLGIKQNIASPIMRDNLS